MALIYILMFSNGKAYVGKTRQTLKQRLAEHLTRARKDSKLAVHRAIRKHGKPDARVLLVCESDAANAYERILIELHSAFGPSGYNLTLGGDGVDMTPDIRAKMSAAAQAREARNRGSAAEQAERVKARRATRAANEVARRAAMGFEKRKVMYRAQRERMTPEQRERAWAAGRKRAQRWRDDARERGNILTRNPK